MSRLLMVRVGVQMHVDEKTFKCFIITKFSNQLLEELDKLNGWPDKVKLMQSNWIGKSYGCELKFDLVDSKESIDVFTTRPDTIFGASFLALSVDHPFNKKFNDSEQFLKFC